MQPQLWFVMLPSKQTIRKVLAALRGGGYAVVSVGSRRAWLHRLGGLDPVGVSPAVLSMMAQHGLLVSTSEGGMFSDTIYTLPPVEDTADA